jgi:hypothetical protein
VTTPPPPSTGQSLQAQVSPPPSTGEGIIPPPPLSTYTPPPPPGSFVPQRPRRVIPNAERPSVAKVVSNDDEAQAALESYWRAGIPAERQGLNVYLVMGHDTGLTGVAFDRYVPMDLPKGTRTWTVVNTNREIKTALFRHPGGVRVRRDFGVLTTVGDGEAVMIPPTRGCSWTGGYKLSGELPDLALRAVVARIAPAAQADDDEMPGERMAPEGLEIAPLGSLTGLVAHRDQGKTTLVAFVSGQRHLDGEHAVVVDFEARRDLRPRWRAMGLPPNAVTVFTRPPVGDISERDALVQAVADRGPSLVAVDGLGRMLNAAHVDFRQSDPVRRFLDATLRRWQSPQCAVLVTELPTVADKAAREPRGGVLGAELDLIWSVHAIRPWAPGRSGLLRIEAVRDRFGDYVHDPVHHLCVLTEDGPLRMVETDPPPSRENAIDNVVVAMVTTSPWRFTAHQIVSALSQFPRREVRRRVKVLKHNGAVVVEVRPHNEGHRKVDRPVYGPGEPS